MIAGAIVRGVIRAERLQRCAEVDGEFCPDNRRIDFPARWSLFAFLTAPGFSISERHDQATRRDQRIRNRAGQLAPEARP